MNRNQVSFPVIMTKSLLLLIFFFIVQSATRENGLQELISNDSLAIVRRFPNVHLNPVEDILKQNDTTQHTELEIKEEEIDLNDHEHECNDDEYDSTDRLSMRHLSKRKNQMKMKNNNVSILQPKIFECFICHKSLKNEHTVSSHLKNFHCESKEWPFVCSKCGKSFKSKGKLRSHDYVHTGQRPYHCSIGGCDKRFTTKPSLKRHLDVNHGILQKAFIRTRTLEYTQPKTDQTTTRNNINHQKPDNDNVKQIKVERLSVEHQPNEQQPTEYKCDFCDQIFSTHNARQSHMMQFHEDAAQFTCGACPKKFFHKYYLQSHFSRVHGPKH